MDHVALGHKIKGAALFNVHKDDDLKSMMGFALYLEHRDAVMSVAAKIRAGELFESSVNHVYI